MVRPLRLLLVCSWLAAGTALACSVPVFRYALEHWQADPFQVLVFHRDALTPEQEASLAQLTPKAGPRPNLLVRRVSLGDTLSPDLAALSKGVPPNADTWLMARFPSSSGIRTPILSAPFHSETLSGLIESPTRRELVQRLSNGESAVWLLLESGNAEADDAATKLLQERLDYLKGVLSLPKLDASDIANGLVSVPESELRLAFSILRVARDDPAETRLVSMLLLSEEGLAEAEQPMVFPIFGQGRVLYALVGAGIKAETIDTAATFLIGKCSCQVKEQNPGVDLLLTASWNPPPPKAPQNANANSAAAVTQTSPSSTAAGQSGATTPEKDGGLSLWSLSAIGLILAGGAAIVLRLRQRGAGVKRRSTRRTRPRLDL